MLFYCHNIPNLTCVTNVVDQKATVQKQNYEGFIVLTAGLAPDFVIFTKVDEDKALALKVTSQFVDVAFVLDVDESTF